MKILLHRLESLSNADCSLMNVSYSFGFDVVPELLHPNLNQLYEISYIAMHSPLIAEMEQERKNDHV